jgi:hypothetical protein
MSGQPAPISHIILLGDALGDLPRIRDRGPGQLENRLLPDWQKPWRLSLIRADDVINRSPLAQIPADASHVVITIEGNRAIATSGLLEGRPESYEEALARLSFAADQFEEVMRSLIRVALATRLPAAVCTMFPPRLQNPVQQRAASTALAIFNDRIIRQAVDVHMPIADLRTACTEAADYSSRGLLSRTGLTKVAALIWKALHDSSGNGYATEIFRL